MEWDRSSSITFAGMTSVTWVSTKSAIFICVHFLHVHTHAHLRARMELPKELTCQICSAMEEDDTYQQPDLVGNLTSLRQQAGILRNLPSSPAVKAGMAALYLYWRVENLVINHAQFREKWQGEIKTFIWRKLGSLETRDSDDVISREIFEIFSRINAEIQRNLDEVTHATLSKKSSSINESS